MPKQKNLTKVLDEKSLETEVIEFVKVSGYTVEDIQNNTEKFQSDFRLWLLGRGYSNDSVNMTLEIESDNTTHNQSKPLPKRITKVTEDLNNCDWPFEVIVDTTKMIPGLVCYTIEKIEPSNLVPYVQYKPSVRIITQVHDSGVNQGTMFLTYRHKVVRTSALDKPNQIQVISEDEVLYSPLTYKQAQFICKLLNIISKRMYTSALKSLSAQLNQYTK